MIPIHDEERCVCARALRSGRFYMKHEACTACNGLIDGREVLPPTRERSGPRVQAVTEAGAHPYLNGNGAHSQLWT